jgi:hypothetical protein
LFKREFKSPRERRATGHAEALPENIHPKQLEKLPSFPREERERERYHVCGCVECCWRESNHTAKACKSTKHATSVEGESSAATVCVRSVGGVRVNSFTSVFTPSVSEEVDRPRSPAPRQPPPQLLRFLHRVRALLPHPQPPLRHLREPASEPLRNRMPLPSRKGFPLLRVPLPGITTPC